MAIAGTEIGIAKLQAHLAELDLEVSIHVGTRFGPEHVCFDERSVVFKNLNERVRAQEVAERFGKGLCRRDPLGFGSSQATVVFSHNCPNTSLPIFWEKTAEWTPLFKRD